MTPMQILKNNFLSFSQKLEKFEEVNLNKSQPKDNWIQNVDDEYSISFPDEETNFSHYTKKGVKSDFIKIFKTKTKKEKCSIAFHFKYLNITESKIQCSIKTGDDFHITDDMNINEFKEKLNQLTKILDTEDTTIIINKTKEVFFNLSKNLKMKFR